MATRRQTPFSWLGRYNQWLGLGVLGAIAAFFRAYQLNSLPPGLLEAEANIGLAAQKLLSHGTIPSFDPATGFAPLWVWLQALPIKIWGPTVLALRVVPVVLGVLTVIAVWYWARQWFGVRVAWITAFLLAVVPWSVAVSRSATVIALIPLLTASLLYTTSRARASSGYHWYLVSGLLLVASLGAGPAGWLLAGTVAILAIASAAHQRLPLPSTLIGLGVVIAGLVALIITAFISPGLSQLTHQATLNLATITSNVLKTLLAFNIHGDESFRYNLGGEPLLNAFVGLMAVAGLLVAIARLHQPPYQALLLVLVIMLLPSFLTPHDLSAARLVGALVPVLALAAIGTSYMLELWYTTFPINSAARGFGQSALLLLMTLTILHGYTQYFRAWAGFPETYSAYQEPAVQAAGYLNKQRGNLRRYVVAAPPELPVVAYLATKTYQPVPTATIGDLPLSSTPKEFIITASARSATVPILKTKFPGGVLRPHYSLFNQAEIFYTYELSQ